jgi:RNA polymerase sigma-70 factor (ECF subfamily)
MEDLVKHHRKFLRFLEVRVGDRAVAEELLQAAYAKSVEKAGAIRDRESAVAWFYRLLRNSITDHSRRKAREARAMARHARDATTAIDPEELKTAVCKCVGHLATTLKEDYARALQRVDVEDGSVAELAVEMGVSPNNAGVRLYRARAALRKQVQAMCGACAKHGCLDCTCRELR